MTTIDIAAINSRYYEPPIPTSTQADPVEFVRRQEAILLNITDRFCIHQAFEILATQNLKSQNSSLATATKTVMGKTYSLTTHHKNRPKITPDLTTTLSNHLNAMSPLEPQLLSCWDGRIQIPGYILSQYFKYNRTISDLCNQNSLALDINSTFENLKRVAGLTAQIASAILLPLYAFSLLNPDTAPSFLQQYAIRFIGTSGPLYSFTSLIPNRFTQGLSAFLAGSFAALGLDNKIRWTLADLKIDAIVQKKLVAIAHYYRKMKEIHTLISQHRNIANHLEHFEKLDTFLKNKDLRNLFRALESRTFDSEAKYFFRRGNMLLAWNLLQDRNVQRQFEPALIAIGEIDAALS